MFETAYFKKLKPGRDGIAWVSAVNHWRGAATFPNPSEAMAYAAKHGATHVVIGTDENPSPRAKRIPRRFR